MLNDRSTTLALLASRRSARPREMVGPGPTATELDTMLAAAARVPDHGKIAPWRFVVIPPDRRAAFADVVARAYGAANPDATDAELAKQIEAFTASPCLVVVLSTPDHAHKIPVWEQEMSAGAACQNLLIAGHALGHVGGWVTGWAAYDATVYAALGGPPGGRIAGFVHFGQPARALDERPRPALGAIVRTWPG